MNEKKKSWIDDVVKLGHVGKVPEGDSVDTAKVVEKMAGKAAKKWCFLEEPNHIEVERVLGRHAGHSYSVRVRHKVPLKEREDYSINGVGSVWIQDINPDATVDVLVNLNKEAWEYIQGEGAE